MDIYFAKSAFCGFFAPELRTEPQFGIMRRFFASKGMEKCRKNTKSDWLASARSAPK